MTRPLDYLLHRGIEVVLEECDGSLKFVEAHFLRKYGNYKLKYTMDKIKNYLKNNNIK